MRKVKRKDETSHFIINSEGRKIENIEEILKEYQKYYQSLLQIRPPENLQEEKIEQDVNMDFKKLQMMNIMLKGKNNTARGEKSNPQNEK